MRADVWLFVEVRPLNRREWLRIGVVTLLAAIAIGGYAWWYAERAVERVAGWQFPSNLVAAADNFRPVQVVPRQKPITSFDIVPARKVGNRINPSELVIGVTVNDQTRAYPINMLVGPAREILNDKLGGEAIAATW